MSKPLGAMILSRKTVNEAFGFRGRTPLLVTDVESLEGVYYQAVLAGYHDSEIVYCPPTDEDRIVYLPLKPWGSLQTIPVRPTTVTHEAVSRP